MNHRRNNPIRINVNDDEIVMLFLNLLCREPFLETFYFADAVAPPIPIPHGQKGTRQRAALARLNSDEFHLRNHSGDRRFTDVTLEITRIEIFRKYHEPNHGNMNVDCCLLIKIFYIKLIKFDRSKISISWFKRKQFKPGMLVPYFILI